MAEPLDLVEHSAFFSIGFYSKNNVKAVYLDPKVGKFELELHENGPNMRKKVTQIPWDIREYGVFRSDGPF